MPAGDLREMVKFERRIIQADDGYGNTEGAWKELGSAPARIESLAGSEQVLQDRLAPVNDVEITVRWNSVTCGLIASDRVTDMRSRRRYNVTQSINPDEHRRYVNILATHDGLASEEGGA